MQSTETVVITQDSTHAPKSDSGSGIALPPDIELGHYRIIRKIGKGGFGITYLATDTLTNEQVVIKENMPAFYAYRNEKTLKIYPFDAEGSAKNYRHLLTRFVEEARILARLDHPNIVRVHNAFEALGTAYYVMPYIPGKELHKVTPDVVDEAWLTPILRALLKALDYLHAKGLLHRDIKPGNILLQEDDTPILIDFGTARALNTDHSATMVNTPGYTPLEQITPHGKHGPWTDIYALGATCYRIITGQLPPDAVARIDGDPLYHPLSTQAELRERFSEKLLKSIDKALSMKETDRWQTATDWLNMLPEEENEQHTRLVSVKIISSDDAHTPRRKRYYIIGIILLLIIPLLYCLYAWEKAYVEERIRLAVEAALQAAASAPAEPEKETAPAEEATPAPPPPIRPLAHELSPDFTAQDEATAESAENCTSDATECDSTEHDSSAISSDCTGKGENSPLDHDCSRHAAEETDSPSDSPSESDCKPTEDTRHEAIDTLRGMGINNYNVAILSAYNDPHKLRLLIDAGADVNYQDRNGNTPLRMAARYGRTECVKLLLAASGIDVNLVNRNGETPLYWAACNGQTECVKLLLAAPGIDVNLAETREGMSPLCAAAKYGRTPCLQLLLAVPGIEINQTSFNGGTPLYWAASHGKTECVRHLLTNGSTNVNRANNNGETPLLWAALKGYTACVQLLIEAGADVNQGDYSTPSRTPLKIAKNKRHAECVKLLENAGAIR